MKLFRKKFNSKNALYKLQETGGRIDKKISRLKRLQQKKSASEATHEKLEKGIQKLEREKQNIVNAIQKLSEINEN